MTDESGTPVIGAVTVAVAGLQSIQKQAGGAFKVTGYGVPGMKCYLLRSGSLTSPDWQPVGAQVVAGQDGYVELIDGNPPAGQAFYRGAVTGP